MMKMFSGKSEVTDSIRIISTGVLQQSLDESKTVCPKCKTEVLYSWSNDCDVCGFVFVQKEIMPYILIDGKLVKTFDDSWDTWQK